MLYIATQQIDYYNMLSIFKFNFDNIFIKFNNELNYFAT